MAEMLSKSDFDAIKRDIEDAGKTVNTDAVIDPRYGDRYKSFPMLSRLFEAMLDQGLLDLDELNQVIQIAAAAGAGENGWTAQLIVDGSKTQKQINNEAIFQSQDLASVERIDGQIASKDGDFYKLNIQDTEDPDNFFRVEAGIGAWNWLPSHFNMPSVFAKNIKTDGTDQLAVLNQYAQYAASKRLKLVLPTGTITINGEFIPPNRLVMCSINSLATWSTNSSGTVLKWGATEEEGAGKAVLRCSRSPIGVTPTDAITAVELDGIHIDASNCDYGAYFRYFTNESRVKNLVVRNAKKCNIWGGQLWFSWFDHLISVTAQDKGVVLGIPLAGETGDLAVNAINFPYVRSHSSGQAGTYDAVNNPDGGAGIMFNTQSCAYGVMQAELSGGVGVINKSVSRVNNIFTLYLEKNCESSSEELKVSYVQDTGSSGTPCTLRGVTLATKQVILNNNSNSPLYIEDLNPIDRTYQCLNGPAGTAGFSFSGFETPALQGMSADEQIRLVKFSVKSYWSAEDVNLRYTSQVAGAKFRVLNHTEYVHLLVIPKISAIGAFTFTVHFAGDTFAYTITDPVAGQVYRVRRPTLNRGVYTLTINAGTAADFLVDIIIASGVYGNNRPARYITL